MIQCYLSRGTGYHFSQNLPYLMKLFFFFLITYHFLYCYITVSGLKCYAKVLRRSFSSRFSKLDLSSSIVNVLRPGTTSYPSVSPMTPDLVRQEFNKYLPKSLFIYLFHAGYWARPWEEERRNQIQIFHSRSF